MAGARGAKGVVLGLLSKSPLFMFHAALWLIISLVLNPPPPQPPQPSLSYHPSPSVRPHATLTEGLIVGRELTLSKLNQTLI